MSGASGSSEQASWTDAVGKGPSKPSSWWLWPLVCGSVLGISLGMTMPRLWYLWLPVGWLMGLTIGISLRPSGDSEPFEEAGNG